MQLRVIPYRIRVLGFGSELVKTERPDSDELAYLEARVERSRSLGPTSRGREWPGELDLALPTFRPRSLQRKYA